MSLKLRASHRRPTPRRRGRPTKFGVPSQPVTMTLPRAVVDWLKTLHPDPATALVSLHDRLGTGRRASEPPQAVRLVPLHQRRSLIVVDPTVLRHVAGVTTIPLADGRALVSLGASRGLADFELAINDRRQAIMPKTNEARRLEALQTQLGRWRKDARLSLTSRSIIVVEHRRPAHRP